MHLSIDSAKRAKPYFHKKALNRKTRAALRKMREVKVR